MTSPAPVTFTALDLDALAGAEGCVALVLPADGKLGPAARRVGRLTKGAVARAVEGEAFEKLSSGEVMALGYPTGMAAEKLLLVKLDNKADAVAARAAGVALAKASGGKALTLAAGNHRAAREVALGAVLRSYSFTDHKTDKGEAPGAVTVMVSKPEEHEGAGDEIAALADGVFFARDLVSAPANVLTTETFADKLVELREMGVEVEVLDEDELEKLGMRTLLAVGHGSETPSKVVVMQWKGAEGAPLALIGKGVVFDTGGISLKPAAGMEDMTMDMGGAGTVAGAMKAIAGRKAKAHVVGLVGLVENMPDGRAQRPGDIVTSMKGDTVEVINTDAEGRLVLCDVMWYAQDRFKPAGLIDLATLTGAIIIGLGHDNAGVFSNDDAFCDSFLAAAQAEGEGAWRMPLGKGYAKLLKSDKADVKNVGGRPAGSCTAAEFLHRFVKEGMPWIHLDIAGVAQCAESPYAPKGATGWGVLALNRLVRDGYEGK
jgi:leucyl aminopeptidase